MQRKDRIYRGVVITPAGLNGSGIRWTANLHDGLPARADTLNGIKQLIRERLKVKALCNCGAAEAGGPHRSWCGIRQ